ncbi:MAG: Zn-dependent exopeptidase M28, partial [Thermoplasmatales archaeon]|nr:Zn-dependent exopeptidase M28 [Thermoplasmatales archaeon]
NQPPDKPSIDGPTSGKAGEEYDYTVSVVDPNDDVVYYYIEWGDGNIEEWIGSYDSGEEVIISHSWDEQKTYTIRAKAKDSHDARATGQH